MSDDSANEIESIRASSLPFVIHMLLCEVCMQAVGAASSTWTAADVFYLCDGKN
jgi:hypothetical protein